MAIIIATLALSPEGLALEHALTEVSDVRIEAERTAGHGPGWMIPCLWVAGDVDAFGAALEDDPTIEEIVAVQKYHDERFYHVKWSEEVDERVWTIVDHEGSILAAQVRDGDWRLQVRFTSRDQFESFREYLSEQESSYRLLDLEESVAPTHEMGAVSGAQRAALVTAVEKGYFDVPRNATVEDVAQELGISQQAASERLRRGVKNLVRASLITAESPLDA